MKKILLYLITVLFVTVPFRCFAFLFLLALLVLIRQSVEKPSIMDQWEGFFQPQIKVKSNILGGGSEILSIDECTFIQPTKVKAYKGCCDISQSRKADKEVTVEGIMRCKEGSMACICAKRVLASCETDLHPNPGLGCINIPSGPSPPPFYNHFVQSPEVKIVPVRDSSFFSPAIKVMVGSGDKKRCDNGAIIDINANCIDNSTGVLSGYSTNVLRLNYDGSSIGRKSLAYNGKQYFFEAKKRDDQICGLYYGNDGSVTKAVSSVCYDIPKPAKPEIINYPPNIVSLLQSNSRIDISTRINGYNGNQPFNLYYNGVGVLHNDTKLKLKRLKMGNDHFFEVKFLCKNSSGNSVVGSVVNGNISCPLGYDKGVVMRYKENPNSRVLCISEEESGVNEYMLVRGNEIFKITELGKGFIPHKYYSYANKWLIDYSKYNSNMLIEHEDQALLDKIKNTGANLFSIHADSTGYYNAKYKKLEIVSRLSDVPDDVRAYVNRIVFDAEDAKRYNMYNGSTQYTVTTTNFINSINNKAFFLTKDEEDQSRYLPLDPYRRGLCITDFAYQDYTNIGAEEFFDAKLQKCEFVTVEAWGGGAAGHIFADLNDPLTSIHGQSFSGSSGGYTKGTIKIENIKNILKIKIGKGGDASNKAGELTEVHLCNSDKSNCTKLLSANGGEAFRGKAQAIDFNDINYFDKNTILHADKFSGNIGQYETTSKPNPDVPEPIILPNSKKQGNYIAWNKTFCYSGTVNAARAPGSGGCVSRANGIWQPGADGRIRVTCERWNN